MAEVLSLDRDAATTEVKDANSVTVIVNEKSYTMGKTPPIQPNISISLGISGDQRTACVSGFQEGIPMVIILLMQLIVHLPFSQLGFLLDIFEILQGDRSSDMLCDDIFGVSPIRVQKLVCFLLFFN